MYPPLSINTDSVNNVDHISNLELAFCSYFECCNLQLPDFHAFVDHCEEEHISRSRPMPFYKALKTPNGTETQTKSVPQPSLPSSSSTSRASSVMSSPTTPTSPLFPMLDDGRKQLSNNLAYTPFNPAISVDLNQVYPELADDVSSLFHYDYDYDFGYEYYSRGASSPPSSDESDGADSTFSVPYGDEMSPPPTPATPTASPVFSFKKAIKANRVDSSSPMKFKVPHGIKRTEGISSVDTPRAFETPGAAAGKGLKIKSRPSGHSGKNSKRERAFRCPNAGCTKTYLNPNGLKYHLEKGTCKIEDDANASEVVDVVSTGLTENSRGTSSERVTVTSPSPSHSPFSSTYPQQHSQSTPTIQRLGLIPQVSHDGQQRSVSASSVGVKSPRLGDFRGYFGNGNGTGRHFAQHGHGHTMASSGRASASASPPAHHGASPVIISQAAYDQHASDPAASASVIHMTR